MDDLGALDAAAAEFRKRLEAVGDAQWDAPTNCGEWTVTNLVEHVAGGNHMSELLLHGADAATALAAARASSDADLAAAVAASVAAQAAAFAEAGALERIVHHPAMDMPGETLLMFRTLDLMVHAWDLATSLDDDTALDGELVESVWTRLEPFAELLPASGMFGTPDGEIAADASAQEKLLHSIGR